MRKFHILTINDGVPEFVELAGVLINISEVVQGFYLISECECYYDLQTGGRLWTIYDEGEEALERAQRLIKENGLLWWREKQMGFSAKYGLPPELEVEIVRYPRQLPEGYETCEAYCRQPCTSMEVRK